MNITIEGENIDGREALLSFSDKDVENDLFVEVWFGENVYMFELYDLLAAVIAFKEKRDCRLEAEKV